MGEFLDRGYQRQLLDELRAIYPNMEIYQAGIDEAARRRSVNLHYLLEHELISGKVEATYADGNGYVVRISAKGLDFLQDDGGLGAILGVVTVKLHDDTIRQLLLQRVEADEAATPEEKGKAREVIGKMSGEALTTVVKELTKMGLKHVPDAIPWIIHTGQLGMRAMGIA